MSDHPTVTAAAQALERIHEDLGAYGLSYVDDAKSAVAAAFRERAVHAYDQAGTTESTVQQFRLRLIAEQMDTWADEIEASRGSA